jgi:hypothetical protein
MLSRSEFSPCTERDPHAEAHECEARNDRDQMAERARECDAGKPNNANHDHRRD